MEEVDEPFDKDLLNISHNKILWRLEDESGSESYNILFSCFRFGQAWDSLCPGEEGGHQDHQQGEAERVSAAEGGEGDRHHEADRASERAVSVRCLREQKIFVPGAGACEWRRIIWLSGQEGETHS